MMVSVVLEKEEVTSHQMIVIHYNLIPFWQDFSTYHKLTRFATTIVEQIVHQEPEQLPAGMLNIN